LDAITWAQNRGLVTGQSGNFYPHNNISREALILVLYRYHMSTISDSNPTSNTLNNFRDRDSIAPVAYDAMSWAVANGLMTGSNNFLHPGNAMTRAMTVLVLYRYVNKFIGVTSSFMPEQKFGFMDMHTDMISRAIRLPAGQQGLFDNSRLDVDFKRLSQFAAPVQVFALWCPNDWVASAFDQTNRMIDFFEQEVAKHSDIIEIAHDLNDIKRISGAGKISAILAIEGGEALMGRIENLDHFYNRGVRIFGLTWNRENALGFGRATGSTQGLKPFGLQCIERMNQLGIIIDVSHLNDAGFWDVYNKTTRPYIASHSNIYRVHNRSTNLRDDQIKAIVDRGGVIGINFYPPALTANRNATIGDVMAQFRYLINFGAGNHIVLGSDFDGITTKPIGLNDVSSLHTLADTITFEFGDFMSIKIMEGNFYDFLIRYFEG